jgi:phosphocarrier protein HPr
VSAEVLVTINRENGLHARPALELVNAVKASGLEVTIGFVDKEPVNAASLLAVLAQGFSQGAEVRLSAQGDGSEVVLERAAEILSSSD